MLFKNHKVSANLNVFSIIWQDFHSTMVVCCVSRRVSLPNMRSVRGIHRGAGLESDRGQTSKTMLPE
jgi:hypothetical protein